MYGLRSECQGVPYIHLGRNETRRVGAFSSTVAFTSRGDMMANALCPEYQLSFFTEKCSESNRARSK